MTDDLLTQLAQAGAEHCGYHYDPEQWAKGACDCKYVPGFAGVAEGLRTSEQTGCAEIRRAYEILSKEPTR